MLLFPECLLPSRHRVLPFVCINKKPFSRQGSRIIFIPISQTSETKAQGVRSGSGGTRSGFCSVGDPEFFLGLYSFLGMGSRCRWQMLLSAYSNLIPFTGQ